MPLKRCNSDGKSGWKWGESGKCFTGPQGKKKAIKQGIAIEGPKKFSQKAYEDGDHFNEEDIEYVLEIGYAEYGMGFNDGMIVGGQLYLIEGWSEDISEDNFIVPSEANYIDIKEEDQEDWDIAKEKPGLWENIRKKKDREGKNYRPARPGDKDRPDPESFKKSQSDFKYENPKTGEVFTFKRKGVYKKDGIFLRFVGKASEYQGRKVTLNKPFRTPDGPKKFAVYTKNESGNVVIVRFGDPNMEIKKDNPKRRKSFRARHKCETPGPKWKARYWSCKMW